MCDCLLNQFTSVGLFNVNCRVFKSAALSKSPQTSTQLRYTSTRRETGRSGGDKSVCGEERRGETAAHPARRGLRERRTGSGKTRPPAPGSRCDPRRTGRLETAALSAQTQTTPFCKTVTHDVEARDGSADAARGGAEGCCTGGGKERGCRPPGDPRELRKGAFFFFF